VRTTRERRRTGCIALRSTATTLRSRATNLGEPAARLAILPSVLPRLSPPGTLTPSTRYLCSQRHPRPNLITHVKYSPPRASFHTVRASFVHGPGQQVQLAPLSGPGSTSHSGLIDPCNLFIKVRAGSLSTSGKTINTRFTSEPRHLHHLKRALYPLPSSECPINLEPSRFLLFRIVRTYRQVGFPAGCGVAI